MHVWSTQSKLTFMMAGEGGGGRGKTWKNVCTGAMISPVELEENRQRYAEKNRELTARIDILSDH